MSEAPDPEQGPYASAAGLYWQAGWRGVLPLPPHQKADPPKGYTGRDGAWPSYPDVYAWSEERPLANVCLRLPPNVIGVDVDHYGDKHGGDTLAELEARLGPLPPTWRVTSRDDGISGIRLYRIPEGLRWPGVFGASIESIRTEHRYAVVWPSIHPEGGTYRWIDPVGVTTIGVVPVIDDLPEMPDVWVQHFTGGVAAVDQPMVHLGQAGVTEWLKAHDGTGGLCRHMQRVTGDAQTAVTSGASRHDAALAATNRIVWLMGEGHTGGVTALSAVCRTFIQAVGNDRPIDVLQAEWGRMVDGAVGMSAAQHPRPSTDPCLDPFASVRPLIGTQWTPPPTTPTSPGSQKSSTGGLPSLTGSLPPSSGLPTPSSTPAAPSGSNFSDGLIPPQSTNSPTSTLGPTEASTPTSTAPTATWARADLTTYLDGTYEPVVATLMPRDDGVCLIYPARTHSFHGESESGKSMVLQIETARLLNLGCDVLYLDFESDAASIVERLLLLGGRRDMIAAHLDYRRPEVNPSLTPEELTAWYDMIGHRYVLAVIDGVTDALSIFGMSTKDNDDITRWARALPRAIADRTGAAVVVIDHVIKDSENRGRFAIGGQAKMNGLTGAAYTVEVRQPLGRGLKGEIVLRVGKDRIGYIRGQAGPMKDDRTQEVARIWIDSTSGDRIEAVIEAITGADIPREARPKMRMTATMEKVSRTLEAADKPLSLRSLRELIGGNKDHLTVAIRDLLLDGYITIEDGPRGATMHVLARNYRQREDPKSDIYDPLTNVETSTVADRGRPWLDRGSATVTGTVADRGPTPYEVGVGRGHGHDENGTGHKVDRGPAGSTPIAGGKFLYDRSTGQLTDPKTGEVVEQGHLDD